MRTSPNREQTLFLIAGGVILALILAVVAFNLAQSPVPTPREESAIPRAVVAMPPSTGTANPGGESPEGDRPWLSTVSPASVFKQETTLAKTPMETVESTAADPSTQHDVAKRQGPPPPASQNEVVSRPITPPPEESAPDVAKTEVAPPAPAAVPVAKAAGKPAPATEVKASGVKPPAGSSPGTPGGRNVYTVSLAALSEESNVNALQQRVTSLGLPVLRQNISAQNRPLVRVRAGPFASRAEAEMAATLIRDRLGIHGTVAGSAPVQHSE